MDRVRAQCPQLGVLPEVLGNKLKAKMHSRIIGDTFKYQGGLAGRSCKIEVPGGTIPIVIELVDTFQNEIVVYDPEKDQMSNLPTWHMCHYAELTNRYEHLTFPPQAILMIRLLVLEGCV